MFPPRQALPEPLPQTPARCRAEAKPQAVVAVWIGRPGAMRAGRGQVAAGRTNALNHVTLREAVETGASPARNPGVTVDRGNRERVCRPPFSIWNSHSQWPTPRGQKTETPISCPAELPVGNRRLRQGHQKATQGRRFRLRAARIVSVSHCFDHLTLWPDSNYKDETSLKFGVWAFF